MKRSFFTLLVFFISLIGFCQNQLLVQSNDKGLYITHTVIAKENFYSISRTYNIPPKEIAAFNQLDMSGGLSIGQHLMIPLSAANFNQAVDNGIPVYYEVGEKEGLYRVSTKNNKVLMANLRKWNNLSNDNLSPGTKLIIGYLIGSDVQNPASNSVVKTDDDNKQQKKEQKKQEKDFKEQQEKLKKKDIAVTDTRPVTTSNTNQSAPQNSGYFKSQFELQAKTYPVSKEQTVTAGIFKTASGWQDGKYYALIDNVEPGTIIQVVNPTNNKAVYAKVLGQMGGIRQNQGLNLRISNAAASILDIAEPDKFVLKVHY
jgi:LysM repeat protein